MEGPRWRLEDLRRFASGLLTASALAPLRASSLAGYLLWHDAAGLPAHGFATLPGWLERIDRREVNPSAEGKVTGETMGTAVCDGENGVPPLVLARAGELAIEKARAAGIGLVRIGNLGSNGPAGAVAADLAIGPYAGMIVDHTGAWALALPAPEGLPVVYDCRFGAGAPAEAPLPWAAALAPDGGWLVAGLAVSALEPLATFHERMDELFHGHAEVPGWLLPGPWEARRTEARTHGVRVDAAVIDRLRPWSERAHLALPQAATPHDPRRDDAP
jgi:LDH2 family malate/lactate/ureidoglycolate dehydrogenase